jgi:ubiquinone/menaquinone biosynthesis C-methylase UbiE
MVWVYNHTAVVTYRFYGNTRMCNLALESSMHTREALESIWASVPPDYYQQGVKNNLLQRFWHLGKLRVVLSLIPKHPKTILDAGSASGWFLSQVSSAYPHAKCTGIDVYEKAILYAKTLYPNISFLVADVHNIPLRSSSFDLVMCNEVLEHVVDPKKVLSEIKRVMKPEGRAIIEMDSGNFLFRIAWHWWTHMRHGVWEDAHIQVFNAKKLEQMIRDCGFIIEKKKFFNLGMAVAFLVKKRIHA